MLGVARSRWEAKRFSKLAPGFAMAAKGPTRQSAGNRRDGPPLRYEHFEHPRFAAKMARTDSVKGTQATSSDDVARDSGLRFVTDTDPGIRRRPSRRGFSYFGPDGKSVHDRGTIDRIRRLAVPPAWQDVWICPHPHGHIQATGRDARNRKQYRYHSDWQRVRDELKYGRLLAFARELPDIRRAITRDMSEAGLGERKVLATVAHLLDTTLIRVGNPEYARNNKSFGLTTLEDRHADCGSAQIRFRFRGKSGKTWQLKVTDRRVARIVKGCQDLPGQHLFQYKDGEGSIRQVTSTAVNSYLRGITRTETSAKDFRTWAGTVLATSALARLPLVEGLSAKTNSRRAIEEVSRQLKNTPAVCRKCYVHPEVICCYEAGELIEALKVVRTRARRLKASHVSYSMDEAMTLALLEHRLQPKRRPATRSDACGRARRAA